MTQTHRQFLFYNRTRSEQTFALPFTYLLTSTASISAYLHPFKIGSSLMPVARSCMRDRSSARRGSSAPLLAACTTFSLPVPLPCRLYHFRAACTTSSPPILFAACTPRRLYHFVALECGRLTAQFLQHGQRVVQPFAGLGHY